MTRPSGAVRRPGRPRKPLPGPEPGLASTGQRAKDQVRVKPRALRPAVPLLERRLLDLHGAAGYLSISAWTVRDLEAAGVLRRVRVPASGSRDLRKWLFDREDLDALIAGWKESTSP